MDIYIGICTWPEFAYLYSFLSSQLRGIK